MHPQAHTHTHTPSKQDEHGVCSKPIQNSVKQILTGRNRWPASKATESHELYTQAAEKSTPRNQRKITVK